MRQALIILLVCFSIASCAPSDVFEKTVILPGQAWNYNYKPSFSFVINDTSSAYNIFIVLRHTDAYQYNNIWLNVSSRIPGDSTRSQNVDITLGTDANGWAGNGMDDIFEVRSNITHKPISFHKSGKYTIALGQVMRENPLNHILNVGVRVEKVRL